MQLSDRAIVCVLKHVVAAHQRAGAGIGGAERACLWTRLLGRQWAALFCVHHQLVPARRCSVPDLVRRGPQLPPGATAGFVGAYHPIVHIMQVYNHGALPEVVPDNVVEALHGVGGLVCVLFDTTSAHCMAEFRYLATKLAPHCAQVWLYLLCPVPHDFPLALLKAFTRVTIGRYFDDGLVGPEQQLAFDTRLLAARCDDGCDYGALGRLRLLEGGDVQLHYNTSRVHAGEVQTLAREHPQLELAGFTWPLEDLARCGDLVGMRDCVARYGAPLLARLRDDVGCGGVLLAHAAMHGGAAFDEVRAWCPDVPLSVVGVAALCGGHNFGHAEILECITQLCARGLDLFEPFGGAARHGFNLTPEDTTLARAMVGYGANIVVALGPVINVERLCAARIGVRSYMEYAVMAGKITVVRALAGIGVHFDERALLAAARRRRHDVFAAAVEAGAARCTVGPAFVDELVRALWEEGPGKHDTRDATQGPPSTAVAAFIAMMRAK